MKKKKTEPSIRMLLARLGRTKKTVAKKLTELDCRGIRSHRESCPVAIYLRRRCYDVAVEHDHVELPGMIRVTALPKPVKAFVRGFDRGEFPELRI